MLHTRILRLRLFNGVASALLVIFNAAMAVWPMVALVCGVILAALLLRNTSGNAASFGAADLDLAVASYAFDVSSLSGWPTSGSRWAVLRCAPAGWCCPLASSVVGLAGGPSPAGSGS